MADQPEPCMDFRRERGQHSDDLDEAFKRAVSLPPSPNHCDAGVQPVGRVVTYHAAHACSCGSIFSGEGRTQSDAFAAAYRHWAYHSIFQRLQEERQRPTDA